MARGTVMGVCATAIDDGVEIVRDQEADKQSAAFKFKLMETVNADPMLQACDLKVVNAYLRFLKWPKKTSWVPSARLRAMTGLCESTIAKSRRRLCEVGIFREFRMRGNVKVFIVQNPREDVVREHIELLAENNRDREADRRKMRRLLSNVTAKTIGTKTECPDDF